MYYIIVFLICSTCVGFPADTVCPLSKSSTADTITALKVKVTARHWMNPAEKFPSHAVLLLHWMLFWSLCLCRLFYSRCTHRTVKAMHIKWMQWDHEQYHRAERILHSLLTDLSDVPKNVLQRGNFKMKLQISEFGWKTTWISSTWFLNLWVYDASQHIYCMFKFCLSLRSSSQHLLCYRSA